MITVTFLLITYAMSDFEEKNVSEDNLNESLTSDEEISGDEALIDDNVPRIISIQNGEKAGTKCFVWQQNALYFKGFAKAPRSAKHPNQWTIKCHATSQHDSDKCKFFFKANCQFEKNSDGWLNPANWETVKG